MNIDSINNGIVIDHITAGSGMKLYELLHLGDLDCSVALIKNVHSNRMGKKDIIKIDEDIPVDLDVIGYVDPDATVNVIKCKNPRCITTTEQELDHVFKLVDRENKVYRCIYCEAVL